MSGLRLAPATTDDVVAMAALFARSRAAALPFLPVLHTADEDRAFFADCLRHGHVTVARSDTTLAGFMVETDGWIEHLYLDPVYFRQGVGGRLVVAAQDRQPQLSLWCFADNTAALAFYRRHGFVEQRRTAGDNEAGLPDILLHWERN